MKLEKDNDFDLYLTYEINEQWIELPYYKDIYYMEVNKTDTELSFDILKDHKVTLKEEVSKNDLNSLNAYPTLSLTGYAIQQEGISSAVEAWTILNAHAANSEDVNS